MGILDRLGVRAPSPWMLRVVRPGLVQNVLTLYGVHFVNYLLPLVLVPYLAHVLGAAGWGLVAFAQAFGSYVMQVVDYGFNLSATREVARHRDAPDRLAGLLSEVLAAKGMLAAASITLALIVAAWIPAFRAQPAYVGGSLLLAIAQGFQMAWYFQGLERMRLVAALNLMGRALGAGSILLLVRGPGDGWKVLPLQGATYLLATVVALSVAYREVPFQWPSVVRGWKALRTGWSLFVNQGAVKLYATANTLILGLFAPAQFVGYYAGAEKISQALLDLLLSPVSWAVFPRLSHLAHQARSQAIRLARIFVLVTGASGIALGIFLLAAAPIVVPVLLGPEFGPAVPVLRILALLPPVVATGWALANWTLALGMDRAFTVITVSGGLVNVTLAIILAPSYAHVGMALAVVVAETFAATTLFAFLRWRRLDPWTRV